MMCQACETLNGEPAHCLPHEFLRLRAHQEAPILLLGRGEVFQCLCCRSILHRPDHKNELFSCWAFAMPGDL